MKLAKLSLAAIVAAGAMTTFASAAPLEEAIKGVEINGMIRYRFESLKNGDQYRDGSRERHRFSVPVSLTIPVADNLKAGVTVRAEQNEGRTYNGGIGGISDHVANAGQDKTDMVKAWMLYTQPTYSLKAGKFEIATPWTDPGYAGDRGTGALAMYTGVENWTFAAAGFAQTNIDVPNAGGVGEKNLYAAAALGSVGPVDLQLWASKMSNIFDSSFFLEASTKYEGFSIKAQVNRLTVDDVIAGTNDDTGMFYGAEAGFEMAGFNLGAGYTQNDDEQPIYELSADSDKMIKAGKQIYYETSNQNDTRTMFATASYSFDKYRVGAGYVRSKVDINSDHNNQNKQTGSEVYGEVGYKYSKNFDLSAYYSSMDNKDWTGDDKKSDEIRFQALYKF